MRAALGLLAVALVAGGLLYSHFFGSIPSASDCGHLLDRATLTASLEAGTHFLMARQKPAGNFGYEVDWRTGAETAGDNGVRQAGAVWGLALARAARPQPGIDGSLDRAFAFFEANTRRRPDGAAYVLYPGEGQGSTGAVALLALGYIDTLTGPPLPPERARVYRERLDGLVRFLLAARTPEGLFFGNYSSDGKPLGAPSPYSDGEALLALAKMARYLGREDLRPDLARSAEAGHRIHIVQARARDRDSDETKGYYQWSTMAFHELATSGWPEFAPYGGYAIELADWMLDTHRVLMRTRNTGYAFEGILHAMDLARARGDQAHAARFACDAERGLTRLTGWQVGGPRPNGYVSRHGPPPAGLVGGVQNASDEPALRIDVTQHQMHAVALALHWLVP
ncbi:MAG: hypothetical protein EOO75_15925 [Myxococcales bacterium]|nr:MAG: hypothetical protein EOO75_15925 [Myxococcales bacterium]